MTINASSLIQAAGSKRALASVLEIGGEAEGSVCIDQLHNDLIWTIFLQCQFKGDYQSIGRLACVNTHYNQCTTAFCDKFDLKFCPGLTILDAKTQGITVDDEPQINKLAILKYFKELAPHVENNEGLTLLTMTKGLTLNQLVAIAAEKGITVVFGLDQIWQELGDVPVEQTYVILITNNVYKESRDKSYAQHKECVVGHRCDMPTVQEYVALCVFINKCFQKCLYRQNPWTYGRSSTHVLGSPLVVGGSDPARLGVHPDYFDDESHGAVVRRKF